jgi:peptide/nickel transport system permease protein
MVSGYFGLWVDSLIQRIVDTVMAFPALILLLIIISVLGPSITNVVIVVIILLWPDYARLVRGETLSLKHTDYVALARVAGCSNFTIMRRHILRPPRPPSRIDVSMSLW